MTGVWRARRREIRLATDPARRPFVLTVWFETEAAGDGSPEPTAAGDEEVLAARWFAEPPGCVDGSVGARVRGAGEADPRA